MDLYIDSDKLTGRVNAIQLMTRSFDDQRLLAALTRALVNGPSVIDITNDDWHFTWRCSGNAEELDPREDEEGNEEEENEEEEGH